MRWDDIPIGSGFSAQTFGYFGTMPLWSEPRCFKIDERRYVDLDTEKIFFGGPNSGGSYLIFQRLDLDTLYYKTIYL